MDISALKIKKVRINWITNFIGLSQSKYFIAYGSIFHSAVRIALLWLNILWQRNYNLFIRKPGTVIQTNFLDKLAYLKDLSCIKNLLGWQPKIFIFEGLRKTIVWYNQSSKNDQSLY